MSRANRGRSLFPALIALPVALALAGAVYEDIVSAQEARRFPEPGRLVDIGGRRLQLNCTGQGGGRTVILESGLGDSLDEWRLVQPEIAKFARVCSYDRAGYGGSDPGPMPRTSAQTARDLHELLTRTGVNPPYVLVGHSLGGYHVRVFNGAYPAEVGGIILVDSTQEDQYDLLPPAWKDVSAALLHRYQSQARWAPLWIGLGIARWTARSQGIQDAHLILQPKYLRARAAELEAIRTSAEQARASDHMQDKPLIVLTAGRNPDEEFRKIWVDNLQLRLASLSTRGKQVVVPDSGHDIPGERPDAVVDAVRHAEPRT